MVGGDDDNGGDVDGAHVVVDVVEHVSDRVLDSIFVVGHSFHV